MRQRLRVLGEPRCGEGQQTSTGNVHEALSNSDPLSLSVEIAVAACHRIEGVDVLELNG